MVAALVLRRSLTRGEASGFIMELPKYQMPLLRDMAIGLWQRAWIFLRRAGTIIFMVTVVLWLLLAASGLPLLAGGSGGWERFLGPTGGFLLAFPLAAALTGWLAERGWDGGRVGRAFAAMLIGHVLCLLLGGAWLAASIGLPKALAAGVLPFIPGALLKSALGAGLLKAIAVMRAPPTA